MPTPLSTQIEGAEFLASRRSALLADAPRVGKTGAAIIACDKVEARSVLAITTATNRYNFARDVREWQTIDRSVGVVTGVASIPDTDVVVLPWSLTTSKVVVEALLARRWDVLIVDESHYAKNPAAQRTRAIFGSFNQAIGLAHHAARVWLLSGTPVPNAPIDLWPALRALEHGRLEADARGWPSVVYHDAFLHRYCTVAPRFVARRRIEVVTGGKNEAELRERLDGWFLRRTQADVGIQPPQYDTLLLPPERIPQDALDFDEAEILTAAEAGETRKLERHLGELRRLTGRLKAAGVAALVEEEFECGLDSVVLMCWHRETVARLACALGKRGCAILTGASTPMERQRAQAQFQTESVKVFVGQIQAAGEAIDLSRSCNLIFVEPSFTPKDMAQAALRITNHSQERNCLVRVAALAGSIDEKIMAILTRKVASIQKVLEQRTAA